MSSKYEKDLERYTRDLIKCPEDYLTRLKRADTYVKLGRLSEADEDFRCIIRLDPPLDTKCKAYFSLSKVLIEQKAWSEDTLGILQRAYELAINTERNDDAIELVEHIRLTRYNIWRREQRQANTATRQADLLSYLEHLIQEDYKSEREVLDRFERRNTGSSIHVLRRHAEDEYKRKMALLKQVFESVSPERRTVPAHFCDMFSSSIMYDPVVTPSGHTYERAYIYKHLRSGNGTDPLTRRRLRKEDLVPNRALKDAIEAFLSKNGWANDC